MKPGCSLFVCAFLMCSLPLVAAEGASPIPPNFTAIKQNFHGLDLTEAPRTTTASMLPDLWEQRPKGSGSYEIRNDVNCVYRGFDGAVYHVPAKNCFYIQSDLLGSSTMTYYGPFPGDPTKELKLEKKSADKAPHPRASEPK